MTFLAYDNAIEIITALKPALDELKRHNKDLADQLRRAASSIALNVAEGSRRTGKDRIHFYRIAAGSAAESSAAIDVAAAWGEISEEAASRVRTRLDRELRLLRGLTR